MKTKTDWLAIVYIVIWCILGVGIVVLGASIPMAVIISRVP